MYGISIHILLSPWIYAYQLQLQSALLNASSGVVQSLAAQTNIPATILSSALLNANMAATLSAASSNTGNCSCAYMFILSVHMHIQGLLPCELNSMRYICDDIGL